MYLYTDECLNSFPGVKLATQTYFDKVTSCKRRNPPMENKINIKVHNAWQFISFITQCIADVNAHKKSKIFFNLMQCRVVYDTANAFVSFYCPMEEGTECQN